MSRTDDLPWQLCEDYAVDILRRLFRKSSTSPSVRTVGTQRPRSAARSSRCGRSTTRSTDRSWPRLRKLSAPAPTHVPVTARLTSNSSRQYSPHRRKTRMTPIPGMGAFRVQCAARLGGLPLIEARPQSAASLVVGKNRKPRSSSESGGAAGTSRTLLFACLTTGSAPASASWCERSRLRPPRHTLRGL